MFSRVLLLHTLHDVLVQNQQDWIKKSKGGVTINFCQISVEH